MDYKVVDCHTDNTIFNNKKWVEYTPEVKQALEIYDKMKNMVSCQDVAVYKSCGNCINGSPRMTQTCRECNDWNNYLYDKTK